MRESTMFKDVACGSRAVRSHRLAILLVDDNDVLRIALRRILGLMGHTIDLARDGREALEAAAVGEYDAIMLDVQMPEIGGFEAARLLRLAKTGRRVPRIIGLSSESADRELYTAAGMDDFLIKPIRRGDLARVLDGLVPGRLPSAC
jgi:CheY-like chemotaxis protein